MKKIILNFENFLYYSEDQENDLLTQNAIIIARKLELEKEISTLIKVLKEYKKRGF